MHEKSDLKIIWGASLFEDVCSVEIYNEKYSCDYMCKLPELNAYENPNGQEECIPS